jgi:hypothetical protein
MSAALRQPRAMAAPAAARARDQHRLTAQLHQTSENQLGQSLHDPRHYSRSFSPAKADPVNPRKALTASRDRYARRPMTLSRYFIAAIALSAICMVHCLAMLLVAVLPIAAVSFSDNAHFTV